VFLIDERYVDETSQYSNTSLVKKAAAGSEAEKTFTEGHFIYPNTSLTINECVDDYDKRVKAILHKCAEPNRVDIQVLGLGADGHIASLFPPVEVSIREKTNILHTTTDVNPVNDRITLPLQLLTQAHHSVFFMCGEAKLKVWDKMLECQYNPERWPAHAVLSQSETTLILGL